MSIKLFHNDQPVEIRANKVGEIYEVDYSWEIGEEYTLEVETSTLDGVGVTIRTSEQLETHRFTDDSVPEELLDLAPQLDEIRPGEELSYPVNAEVTNTYTTMGLKQTYLIADGWGQSRIILRFRPKPWSREYVLRKA